MPRKAKNNTGVSTIVSDGKVYHLRATPIMELTFNNGAYEVKIGLTIEEAIHYFHQIADKLSDSTLKREWRRIAKERGF